MFEFLKSKKRKEKERLEKDALEARQKRLSQQPYKRNPPPPATQQIHGSDYSAAYWLSQPTNFVPEQRSFISANETREGSGSFSGAGSSSSWDDDSSSSSSSSYSSSSCGSSSYDSSSSSSDSSSSCSSD